MSTRFLNYMFNPSSVAVIGSAKPDFQNVAKRAREMEQIMNQWRKEYDSLSE